jgi:predicted AlkP superfamily pyrophosphatase or phosphodiesterase
MMKQGGAYANGMEGVYPTATYPQHTAMVTGLRPAAHGIVQNRVFEAPSEPQTRYWYWYAKALKAETLWTMAKKREQVLVRAYRLRQRIAESSPNSGIFYPRL